MSNAHAQCLAQSAEWDLRATATLPRGQLTLVVGPAVNGTVSIEVGHVKLVDRDDDVEQSQSFDDGRVVVDRGADGKIVGIEFLAQKDPDDLPEFVRAIRATRDRGERAILEAAYSTVMLHWARFEFFLRAWIADGPEAAKRKLDDVDEKVRDAIERATKTPSVDGNSWSAWRHAGVGFSAQR